MTSLSSKEKTLPWMVLPSVWKTEAAFLAYIRGGIRRSLWNRSPIKIEFINKNRFKIPNPNPKAAIKMVWGGTCALTGVTVPLKFLEVDHKVGNHSLRSLSDIQSFVEGIVLVTLDDLQFVTKEAHKIKSYAEKQGCSFIEAVAHKKAIEMDKQPVKKVVDFLTKNGYNPASTKPERRKQLYELFLKESK